MPKAYTGPMGGRSAARYYLALGCWMSVMAGCQVYDFQPVEPLTIAQTTQPKTVVARALKPNLMLTVDTSGSMLEPVDSTASACRVNGAACGSGPSQSPCPVSCPTRLVEMKSAMNNFLTQFGTSARMGAVYYPRDPLCSAPSAGQVDVALPGASNSDDDAALANQSAQVNSVIQAFTAKGGTPTGNTLKALGTYGPLLDATRDNFILLLTDGLPNCNATNPNYATAACACTVAPVNGVDFCAPGQPLEAKGCLDSDATVAQVRTLRETLGVQTIVVGFGSELTGGDGPKTLQALAEAGGFAVTYYRASNGAELAEQLSVIGGVLSEEVCEMTLDTAPSDPRYISVIVDGEAQAAGWVYGLADSGGVQVPRITFEGALCDRLKASSSSDPVEIEIKIVETF